MVFGPSMKYKNIDFSFFFQGQAECVTYDGGFHPFGTQERRNVLQWIAIDTGARITKTTVPAIRV